MRMYVCGSMAYDRIMNFPGTFSEFILPDKIHMLNVSLVIDHLEEKLGGCGGNIVYSLALLGEKGVVVASAGRDFGRYEAVFKELGLSLEGISVLDEEFTAGAYIFTDASNCQITAFNPGAMRHASTYDFASLGKDDIVMVSPSNVTDMQRYPRLCREKGARCIFDPGQQIPALTGEQLLEAVTGSYMLICNDYELELIGKATGKNLAELCNLTEYIITTLGADGSRVQQGDRAEFVPAVPAKEVLDPTGAGDAYRGALLKGLSLGLSVLESARIGATAASFCVEKYGTQGHAFTLQEFKERHKATFGEVPF